MERVRQVAAGWMVALMLAVATPATAAEVPVPAEAINDEVPAVMWIDLEAMDVEGIRASIRSIADALPEEMAETRDPMLEGVEDDLTEAEQRISALREAGARGMLFVMPSPETLGEEPMVLLYTSAEATPEGIQAAVNEVEAGPQVQPYADNWLRVAEEQSIAIEDGDEANAATFRELLDASGDAPIRVALRLTEQMKQDIAEQADGDPMMAGFAGALESLETAWTAISFGEQPRIENRLNFAGEEAAAEFNAAWEGILMMGEAMFVGELGQMPDAPGPDAVAGVFDALKMEQDGDALSLTLGEEFIGQVAEFVPAVMGLAMMMMMDGAFDQMEDGEWDEPAQEPDQPLF